jgi:hypothetical protein
MARLVPQSFKIIGIFFDKKAGVEMRLVTFTLSV